MTVNQALRAMAGIAVIGSLLLYRYVNPKWIYFTYFVGANLLQSAFTNWCPAMWIFKKIGLKEDC
jgi:hypothetical protein